MLKRLKKIWIRLLVTILPSTKTAKIHRNYYGVKIGKNVRFTGSPNWGSEPYLIEIGDNVTISQDVKFLTHDGGLWVLREKFKGLNYFGKIKIGSNIFIGAGSIILYDVNIGNNVIIGAGSIVTKSIPDNSVVAGVPARLIKTLEEYENNILRKHYIRLDTIDPIRRKEIILEHLSS
jgi:acetyltransferase-like isoleucine patch superfamily enzyme